MLPHWCDHTCVIALVRAPYSCHGVIHNPGWAEFLNHDSVHVPESVDSASGNRHLEGCYTELEDLVSAVRVLRRLDV